MFVDFVLSLNKFRVSSSEAPVRLQLYASGRIAYKDKLQAGTR